jgi:hypothetical protein
MTGAAGAAGKAAAIAAVTIGDGVDKECVASFFVCIMPFISSVTASVQSHTYDERVCLHPVRWPEHICLLVLRGASLTMHIHACVHTLLVLQDVSLIIHAHARVHTADPTLSCRQRPGMRKLKPI